MRIRKVSPEIPLSGNVENTYGNSQVDAYAQEYQNEHNVTVSSTQPTTSERVWFKQGKNLFNKNAISENYELQGSTGNAIYSASFFVSEYIEIEPSTDYYVSGKTSGSSNCFYDENYNFISTTSGVITGKITAPATAKFLRINAALSEKNNNIQIEKGSTATSYEEYILPQILVDNRNFYSQKNLKDILVHIKDDTTNFVIAPNHVNNLMDFYYNKSTGLCVFTFRITTKDNDPQYNTVNAWQTQVTIPSKYSPRAINFNPVYIGAPTAVARLQPRTDSANKGKLDVYAYASYYLVEGTLIWYIEPGIN